MPQLTGTYTIESVRFDSEPRKGLITVTSPQPGAPVLCYRELPSTSQQFNVTPAPKGKGGYHFICVDPDTNVFVDPFGPGVPVASAPHQWSEFLLREVDVNINQIYVVTDDGKEYAFQAPEEIDGPGQITLAQPDPSSDYQRWRFVQTSVANDA